MSRARLTFVALSAVALSAVALIAGAVRVRRPSPMPAEPRPGVVLGSRAAGVELSSRAGNRGPGVPWLATQAERVLGLLLLASGIAAVVLSVAGRSGRLPEGGADLPLAATMATLILGGVYLMWKVPQWQAAARADHGQLDDRELFEVENAARGTFGQILSGVAVVTGLLFAWQQLGNTNENLEVSQEGQITDRFSRAVEQLGSDDPTVRIGAIYALERIAVDSERDQRPVMEVMASFVRADSGLASPVAGSPAVVAPSVREIEDRAAFGVIRRRDRDRDGAARCIDLFQARLPRINLDGASLGGLCFLEADLSRSILTNSDLAGVSFDRSDLTGANLGRANLSGAVLDNTALAGVNLREANLTGSSLKGADLRGAIVDATTTLANADFNGTRLDGALLFGADLRDVRSLSREQLATALTDDQTRLPPALAGDA